VLFNRFYQPDIDPENLEVSRHLVLSSPAELPLRLRWLAILSGRLRASLAVTGSGALDAVKALMANHAVRWSLWLLKGVEYLRRIRGHRRLDAGARCDRAVGSAALSARRRAYERANYMLMLQGWKAV
jgi:dihydroorotate dehydrogenase (fumarate)